MVAGCEYSYIRQPPTELSCSPYEATRLALTCVVEGPNAPQFSIAWFRSKGRDDQEELQDSQRRVDVQVSYTVPGGNTRHSSRLAIMQLDEMIDVGDYWCQVRLENGTLFQAKSNILTLSDAWEYEAMFSQCSGSQYVEKEDCIVYGNITTTAGSNMQTNQITGGHIEEPESSSTNLSAAYAGIACIVAFFIIIITLSVVLVILVRRRIKAGNLQEYNNCNLPQQYDDTQLHEARSLPVNQKEAIDSKNTDSCTCMASLSPTPPSLVNQNAALESSDVVAYHQTNQIILNENTSYVAATSHQPAPLLELSPVKVKQDEDFDLKENVAYEKLGMIPLKENISYKAVISSRLDLLPEYEEVEY